MNDSSVSGVRLVFGSICWNSDPELYENTSSMDWVDSRVLIRLSPSAPPGRVSIFSVTSSFFALKSFTSAVVIATVASPLSTRNVIVVPLPPLLEPREPALQAVRASEPTATPVTIAQELRLLPSFIASSVGEIGWAGWCCGLSGRERGPPRVGRRVRILRGRSHGAPGRRATARADRRGGPRP